MTEIGDWNVNQANVTSTNLDSTTGVGVTAPPKTRGSSKTWFSDSETASTDQPPVSSYQNKAHLPKLPSPDQVTNQQPSINIPKKSSFFSNQINGATIPGAMKHSSTDGDQLPGSSTGARDVSVDFGFDSALQAVLADTAQEYELSDQQTANLQLAFFHPELATPDTAKLLDEFKSKLSTYMTTNNIHIPENYQPDSSGVDGEVTGDFDSQYETLANDYAESHNLSDTQRQALITLHYIPDAPASDGLKEIASTLEQQATAAVKTDFGLPDSLPTGFPNSGINDYNNRLSANYRAAVQSHVDSAVTTHGLTNDDQVILTYLLANPDTSQTLLALLEANPGIVNNSQDISELQTVITANPNASIADLNVAIKKLNTERSSRKPSAASFNLINDSATSNANNVSSASKEITQLALQDIKDKYQLPPAWAPTGTNLWAGTPQALNGINLLQDIKKIAEKYLSKIPDDSNKMVLANFLKILGMAISTLEQQIFDMEQLDAMMSKKWGDASVDSMNSKVQAQKDAQAANKVLKDKADAADAKSKTFSKVMSIVGPLVLTISIVATIASLGTMGPAALALTLVMTSLSIADTASSGGVTQKAINGLAKGIAFIIKAFYPHPSAKAEKAMELAADVLIVIVVIVACKGKGTKGLGVAVMLGAQIFAGSDMVTQSLVLAGYPKDKAAIIGCCVSAGVVLMCGIGCGIAAARSGVKTAAAVSKELHDAEAVGDNIARTALLAKSLGQPEAVQMKIFVKQLSNFMQVQTLKFSLACMQKGFLTNIQRLLSGVNLINASMGMTNAVYQQQMDNFKGDMAVNQSNAEATQQMFETLIAALKKALKSLMNTLNGFTEWSAELEQMQSSKYKANTVDFPA